MNIEKNTVSAQSQTQKGGIEIVDNGGKYNVLFVGNSITRHAPKSEIGWEHDWGMAASAKDKDYVHVTVKLLEKKLGKVNYAIVNCANWERLYYQDEVLETFAEVKAFHADIIVIRLGENLWSANEHFALYPIPPHYAKMVEFFVVNPNAKIVLTDLFWKNTTINEAIHTVAKEKGYALVPLSDLGCNEENTAIGKFWHEGVAMHPGDIGMQRIAERIAKKILETISFYPPFSSK